MIGRRGGKSFILATIAVFLACFKDWRSYLGPGERATIMIIARDRRQARVIKRFVSGCYMKSTCCGRPSRKRLPRASI